MKWGERVILGGLILVLLAVTVLTAERLAMLRMEQDGVEMLRKSVKEEKEGAKRIVESIIPEGSDLAGNRDILPGYQGLHEKNPDFVGWIMIEGTKIDYPVLQNLEDREYYLYRNFDKEKSCGGLPFVGHGNLEKEPGTAVIYGHNMKNGTMFADLLKYKDKEFWNQNSVISLDTLYEHRTFKIFTAFYANADDWSQIDSPLSLVITGGKMECLDSLNELKGMGIYETGIELRKGKGILLLVTCSYQKKNQRFVVAGIEEDGY